MCKIVIVCRQSTGFKKVQPQRERWSGEGFLSTEFDPAFCEGGGAGEEAIDRTSVCPIRVIPSSSPPLCSLPHAGPHAAGWMRMNRKLYSWSGRGWRKGWLVAIRSPLLSQELNWQGNGRTAVEHTTQTRTDMLDTGCSQLSCTDFDDWQPIYKKFEFCCHFLTQGSQGTPSHHIWLLPWWHWASSRYSACPRTPPGPAAQVYYCFPSSYFLNWASLTQHPSTFPNAT